MLSACIVKVLGCFHRKWLKTAHSEQEIVNRCNLAYLIKIEVLKIRFLETSNAHRGPAGNEGW